MYLCHIKELFMHLRTISTFALALIVIALASTSLFADDKYEHSKNAQNSHARHGAVKLGPRPYFLLNDMDDSALKRKLASCSNLPSRKSEFSIGHRGPAMQFPEHTKESYEAAARMGAGIIECDVTFTADKELVCRHSQCDLHTTTNILETPLAAKCSTQFAPAEFDANGNLIKPASAQCCTSDITVAEFKTLRGKMDASNPRAKNVAEYLNGTAAWRTDLYTGMTSGTLMTHAESIDLIKRLGAKFTPELKSPSVSMPFNGFTQYDYAQKMVDEYKAAGIPAKHVWAQSFDLNDVLYWIQHEPQFGKQAVYLDDIETGDAYPALSDFEALKAQGVNIVAPPTWALLAVDAHNDIVPSTYALDAKRAGLNLITWTFERSDLRNGAYDANGAPTWYYQTTASVVKQPGDIYRTLNVLAKDVGILGIFSDWPATVTYYANCMGLE
jgi:glycerophosphoryl diester phosphodiesterase